MDVVVFNNVLQDLNNFQSKIASLFQDLIKEKVYYKENLEHLCKSLKEASAETEKLKKEIEMLKEDNLSMRNIIYAGIHLFKSLDFSETNKQHTNELAQMVKEMLQKLWEVPKLNLEALPLCSMGSKYNKDREQVALKTIFLKYHTKMENSNANENISSKEKICNKRYELTEEEIQKEIESLESINFCTNLFNDDVISKSTNKECQLQRSCSEKTYKGCVEFKNNEGKIKTMSDTTEECKSVQRAKSFGLDYICSTSGTECDKEILPESNKSPVFKDFNSRRSGGNVNVVEGSGGNSPESWNSSLINEKFLEKVISSDLSSPERSPRTSKSSPSSKSPAHKWVTKSVKIPKFRIPPSNLLKKSYAREIEKTSSGMKILTQTLLNVECFKKKTPEKSKTFGDEENENREGRSINDKKTPDEDVDDIVIEVPKRAEVLKDINNKSTSGPELEEVPFVTPPLMTEHDLDETYISSSIIRKHMLQEEIEQSPLKRRALERTPVKDFPYKDKPVRKKAERMKLPGHACAECNEYYEIALGDIGTQDLKKILNKCSRHRQRYSPSLDDTPPGYWTPYLTGSTMISPNS